MALAFINIYEKRKGDSVERYHSRAKQKKKQFSAKTVRHFSQTERNKSFAKTKPNEIEMQLPTKSHLLRTERIVRERIFLSPFVLCFFFGGKKDTGKYNEKVSNEIFHD
jgi:hypothetical protein